MSENNPERAITGLQRRRPAAVAAGLVRGQRPDPPSVPTSDLEPVSAADQPAPAAPAEPEPEPTSEPLAAQPTSQTPSTGTPRRRKKPAARAPRGQVNADIDTDVRDQARAAFRAAAYFEGVPTFAAYIENAIRRENERVQREHNEGEPFEAISEPLPAGRPLGRGQR